MGPPTDPFFTEGFFFRRLSKEPSVKPLILGNYLATSRTYGCLSRHYGHCKNRKPKPVYSITHLNPYAVLRFPFAQLEILNLLEMHF